MQSNFLKAILLLLLVHSFDLHLAVVAEEALWYARWVVSEQLLFHFTPLVFAFLSDFELGVVRWRAEQLFLDGRQQSLAVLPLLFVGVDDSVEPVLTIVC